MVKTLANDYIGTSCGNSSSLKCASGQCTSRDLQCKTLMGSFTQDNDTYACSNTGCQISCASPEFGANTCYSMQQNFLDGTPCGGGGKCSNGDCQGSTVGKEISSWIDDNKTLVIALASVIGGPYRHRHSLVLYLPRPKTKPSQKIQSTTSTSSTTRVEWQQWLEPRQPVRREEDTQW